MSRPARNWLSILGLTVVVAWLRVAAVQHDTVASRQIANNQEGGRLARKPPLHGRTPRRSGMTD